MGVGDSYLKNHIIELRNERSWTQQQLADALQVSRQTVISIEKNKYMPSLKLAFRIAEVFQKSIYDVFDYEGGIKMSSLSLMNSILAVAGFMAFIGIVICVSKIRDERGIYILNKFFKVMFLVLCSSFSLIIFISSWVDLSYDQYRNMVTILFSLSIITGFFIWIGLWKQN